MLFDFETQKWSTLIQKVVSYPCWSRDGRFLYFLLPFDSRVIARIAILGGKMEQVASTKELQDTGVYGHWLGLTPDDTPLVLRDAGTQEIVSMAWRQR